MAGNTRGRHSGRLGTLFRGLVQLGGLDGPGGGAFVEWAVGDRPADGPGTMDAEVQRGEGAPVDAPSERPGWYSDQDAEPHPGVVPEHERFAATGAVHRPSLRYHRSVVPG